MSALFLSLFYGVRLWWPSFLIDVSTTWWWPPNRYSVWLKKCVSVARWWWVNCCGSCTATSNCPTVCASSDSCGEWTCSARPSCELNFWRYGRESKAPEWAKGCSPGAFITELEALLVPRVMRLVFSARTWIVKWRLRSPCMQNGRQQPVGSPLIYWPSWNSNDI